MLFLPGPVAVAQPVLAAMARPLENHRGPDFAKRLTRVADRLKPIFGTSGPVVLLGSSGTGGMEAAVTSMFSPGDVLLACPIGVFGKRFSEIARTYGCTVEVLETPAGAALDPGAFAARLKADTEKKITGVLLTHNETSTGVQNDMSRYAQALRDHGAISVVDSVSGFGAIHFKMDEWGYDVVVTAAQKALAAPPGMAMVALGERAVARLESSKCSRYYFDLKKALEFSKIGQTPWTPPISIVYALDAALDLYEATGADAVVERHALYARAIRAAFEALGFEIFSHAGAHSVTVVAALPPAGVDPGKLLEALRVDRGVVLSGGQAELAGKIVRMGTMGAISETDILGAIGAIEIALLEADAPVHLGAGVQAALRELIGKAGVPA
ncbi:MAG: alanine--glyoxylate aminotransferase family protein [Candidatus Eremiobacteraeota bacterium]|nr:alanine--glyoxylate aminotransferase family protein [Candidatus Eremiobacteraeota bacterium]